MTALLVLLAFGFAFSMGAHYTGACMGMPRALGVLSARSALFLMAPLALIGAAVASHGVERTVAHRLLDGRGLSVAGLVVVLAVAFGLTSLFNRLRLPTSTIQILVFSVVGTGLAAGVGVHWATIGLLGAIWVAAPFVAAGLGYAVTRLLDQTRLSGSKAPSAPPESDTPGLQAVGRIGFALVVVGAAASFTMGGNDVANATGSLVASGTFDPLVAGLLGGAGIALGVLTWGRPLLDRVAFEIVTVDRPMATAAQAVQAAVVLSAVAFGFFTSMNQALIGAMTGTAAARGRHTVKSATLFGILRGWVVGPGAGLLFSFVVALLVRLGTGHGELLALH